MSVALNINESGLQPGVFWPGKLPSDWQIKRLKFVVRLVSAKAAYGESDLPYMGLEHIESWTGRYLEDEEASPNGVVSHFEPGDVLFGKLRPYLAKVHLARHRGVCSTEALVLRSSEELSPEYLRYFLVAPVTIENINSSTYGSKMPRASWDFIGNQLQPLPPLDQQQNIAAFLDRKTAEIDTLIAKKRRLLDRLAEKRTALITRAVTKGLTNLPGANLNAAKGGGPKGEGMDSPSNPDAPMKDSGIEWLGEIPAHWGSSMLRNFIRTSSGDFISNIDFRREQEEEFEVPMIGGNGVAGYARYANTSRGCIVIGRVGAHCGNVHIANQESWVTDNALKVTFIQEGFKPDYLALLLWISKLNDYANKSAQPLITGETVKRLRVCWPSIEEQVDIVRYVEDFEARNNRTQDKVKAAISKLQEYRSALITNAVTGQIKVA